ncbi:hypothetical protein UlMin_031496 [Ulmus minor]
MAQPGSSMMMNERTDLFKITMKGDWDEVIKIYRKDHDAQKAKITRSGDTALHVAVSNVNEAIVEKLIASITETSSQNSRGPLVMQNEAGNTPLHIAASMGNAKLCELISQVDPILVGIKNKDGETPLFMAALHGRKAAFLCLQSFLPPEGEISYCRRNDGETILHCALAGDYFDLAFQIIGLYRDLVNYFNGNGLTPLHVLASKPSAFQSGSKLGRFKKMVYKCLWVKKLEADRSHQEENYFTKDRSYPENYQTPVNCFVSVWRTLKCAISRNPYERRIELESQEQNSLPPNYSTCVEFIKIVYKAILIVTGGAGIYDGVAKIQEEKDKHTWSLQILDEILENSKIYDYEFPGEIPWFYDDYEHISIFEAIFEGIRYTVGYDKYISPQTSKKDSAILIAAKHGITEIVEKILEKFPVAINDTNVEKKNTVLIAVENWQLEVYRLLVRKYSNDNDGVFRILDSKGNGALHHAANLKKKLPPWTIPGDALQMQWEIKWFKFVEESMPPHFFAPYNKNSETPDEIFTRTHQNLVESGGKWLTNTSQSCSVVAGLFVTIAFTTSTTMPGGAKQDTGTPYLEHEPAFDVFAISSMVTFYSSVIAVVMFLAILTSGYQMKDFEKSLPRKLLLGLTALYVSIASTLVSFCSGHYFILRGQLKEAAAPVYSVICLLVTFFAIAEFPLYFQLARATFKKVPQR